MGYRKKELRKSMVLLILAACLVLVAAALFWLFTANYNRLQLTLNGESEITLEYGSSYEEPGAEAALIYTNSQKPPEKIEVTQFGRVDTQKLGTYRIIYEAVFKKQICTAERIVKVVDTQAPALVLSGDTNVTVLPGREYEEAGFTAVDNYDGDLTSQVQRVERDGKILYTVTDSSGNTATAERTVTVDDSVPPVVELTGGNHITLGIGSSFKEPGFTALDNCDGDLTSSVQVTGYVDTYKEGTYTLTYTVSDSYQNVTTVTRTVRIIPLSADDIAEKNGKVIYLTFDDGPGLYTDRLLDILAKYDVKVSFFVVNTGRISLISRAANEGHTVAIHTATHRFDQVYASEEAYFADLYKMQGIIERYTGIKTTLVRFPGGSSNTISKDYCKGIMTRLATALGEKGFTYFDWNVDSNDAGGAKTADEVFENVTNGVANKKYSVVLQHDMKSYSVDAVERIIVWGLKNGYTFLPLDENSPTCHHGINN